MRILFLSQYFPPEAGATQSRAYEMAQGIVNAGHQVTVITEIPNHPSGMIFPEYKGKFFTKERVAGIDVYRVWVFTSRSKSFLGRIGFYTSYALNAAITGLFLRKSFDLVYLTSPPLFTGLSGLFLHQTLKVPMVFEVRDLWPDSAIALGALQNTLAIRWAFKLEEFCYKHSRQIIAVSQGIRNRLVARSISPDKITIIENGSNPTLFHYKEEKRDELRYQIAPNRKFIVMYTGLMGLAQDFETILQAAEKLLPNPEIIFILIGEGPEKEKIQKRRDQLSLENVQIFPEIQRESVPAYLTASDCAVVPLRRLGLFSGVVPTKMFDAWACERPVILGVEGEAHQILETCRGGVSYTPEDVDSLVDAILYLAQHPAECIAMGKRGRQLVENRYNRLTQAMELVDLFEHLVSRSTIKTEVKDS